jgi:hypothetical protein
MRRESFRGVKKVLLWAVVVVIAILTLPGLIALAWVPSCAGCHEVQAEKAIESPHFEQGVGCRSCHEGQGAWSRIAFNERVMYGMVLHVLPARQPVRAIQNDSCLSCHGQDAGKSVEAENIDREIKAEDIDAGIISSEGLRINHEYCAKDIRCSSCHGGIGHPFSTEWQPRYAMDSCVSCHETQTARQITDCEICHDGRMGKNRSSNSTFAVVHGPDWEQSHGAGDWNTCSPCHRNSMCARCHGDLVPHTGLIVTQHGAVASNSNNKCTTCHRNEQFCNDCHGIQMPHPSGFLKAHSQVTRERGEESCLKCHKRADCDTCHAGHVHPGGPALWNF